MSSYRLLGPHSVGGAYLPTGSTQSTSDVGGLLPVGWVPSGNVDPLDAGAVAAFYAAGPARASPARFAPRPKTFWQRSPGANSGCEIWQLTGLGSALAPVNTQNGCGGNGF
jgi:hypothetical protein